MCFLWVPSATFRSFFLGLAACRFAMLEAIFFLLWVLYRQRFGLFCACDFVAFWCVLGSDLGGVWLLRLAGLQCWRLFFLFYVGSVGNVSAFFALAVS